MVQGYTWETAYYLSICFGQILSGNLVEKYSTTKIDDRLPNSLQTDRENERKETKSLNSSSFLVQGMDIPTKIINFNIFKKFNGLEKKN